jgi:maltooligosyltrehalose trehalohydrolase
VSSESSPARPLGASRIADATWSFVVWAPRAEQVWVQLTDEPAAPFPLASTGRGYFEGEVANLVLAPDYRYVLATGAGDEPRALADPASRWQPFGVHGPSRGFDPSPFVWTDDDFAAPSLIDTVVYELHVGTFSPEGTLDSAIEYLDELVDLGVTAVELMPVNAFPGERNWGYDGAFPFAVQHSYGGPAALQRLVDAAHARGLAVVLDVVYNHLGPEGAVHASYAPYFTDVYATPWGAAINVAEAGSDEVRRYFADNATMWLRDFHVDALRLDAVHGIVDPTASPFLRELTGAVTRLAGEEGRRLTLVAESADNNPLVVSPPGEGGLGFDAQWNDDFHHALHAVLTGEDDSYYQDYGDVDDCVRALAYGFAFRGEYSAFRGRRHGSKERDVPPDRLVVFSQNHDQVGNRPGAERLSELVGRPGARLAAAFVLLSPFVPLLFMGEEYAEPSPFPYFVDHSDPWLLEAVRLGRSAELGHGGDLLDPGAEETFAKARLDRTRAHTADGGVMLDLYRALIKVRREHAVINDPKAASSVFAVEEAVVSVRRNEEETILSAYNLGRSPVSVGVPPGEPVWSTVLDSTSFRFAQEDTAAVTWSGHTVSLPPFGFTLARSDGPR